MLTNNNKTMENPVPSPISPQSLRKEISAMSPVPTPVEAKTQPITQTTSQKPRKKTINLFRSLKIRTKILLSFLSIIVLAGAFSIFSLIQSNNLIRPLYEDIPDNIELLKISSRLDHHAQLIRYYDEVLTQSARNYAFTQDIMWKERYILTVPKLDENIKEAIEEGDQQDKESFSSVDTANLVLIEMEEKSMRLVDEGQAAEAIAILESDEYWKQKEIYQQGLQSYIDRRQIKGEEILTLSTESLDLIAEESLQQVKENRQLILVLAMVVLLVFVLVSLTTSSSIVKPIKKLNKGIEIIKNGNLNHKVGSDAKDEIGQLSRDFDEMTMTIKQSRADIDRKVEEQTKELEIQKEEADKARKSAEEINAAMAGREMKMMELKKEIIKLKGGK